MGVGLILCVCPSSPIGIEGGMWDVIVFIPVHCLSVYFTLTLIHLLQEKRVLFMLLFTKKIVCIS